MHDFYRADKERPADLRQGDAPPALAQRHAFKQYILAPANRVTGDHPPAICPFLRDEAGANWMRFPWAYSRDVSKAVFVKRLSRRN